MADAIAAEPATAARQRREHIRAKAHEIRRWSRVVSDDYQRVYDATDVVHAANELLVLRHEVLLELSWPARHQFKPPHPHPNYQ
jgi:hypothetical protein